MSMGPPQQAWYYPWVQSSRSRPEPIKESSRYEADAIRDDDGGVATFVMSQAQLKKPRAAFNRKQLFRLEQEFQFNM